MVDGAHYLRDSAGIVHVCGTQGSTIVLVCRPLIPYTVEPTFQFDDDKTPTCLWCIAGTRKK